MHMYIVLFRANEARGSWARRRPLQARMTFYLKARNFNGKSFKLTFVSFVQSVFVQKNVI